MAVFKPNVFEGFEIDFTDAYNSYKQEFKDGTRYVYDLNYKLDLDITTPVVKNLEVRKFKTKANIWPEILFKHFYIMIHEHGDKKGECDYNVLIKTLHNSTKEEFADNLVYLFKLLGLEASVLGNSQCVEVLDLPYYQDYYISVEGAWRNIGNYKNYVGVTKEHIRNLLEHTSTTDKEGNITPLKRLK